ncbi:MAG TPA: amidohydrolase family protein [Hyphomicrobiaceae bacterium]|nr:amidohydrolase family protein [Hyphomicrobiaceae bacterium]
MTSPRSLPPSHHLPQRPEWLAKVVEEIIEPDLPIIDPHHHLWEREGNRYLLDDILEDTASGHRIASTVFMECRAMYRQGGDPELACLGETEFVNGIAAMSASGSYGPTRVAEAIIGRVNLMLGAGARRILEAQMAVAGGRFRGVRYITVSHPDPAARGASTNQEPGILRDPRFRASFAELAPLGLTFDAWMYHTQLDELADLARTYPATTIIVDHVGGPLGLGPYQGKRAEVMAEWTKSLKGLASCPNVYMKLGGLGMRFPGFDFHEREMPPTSKQLAEAWSPYLETCISVFGASRCMFESNFPVDKPTCSYQVLWNTFKRVAAKATAEDKRALFSGTAAKVYRLQPAV